MLLRGFDDGRYLRFQRSRSRCLRGQCRSRQLVANADRRGRNPGPSWRALRSATSASTSASARPPAAERSVRAPRKSRRSGRAVEAAVPLGGAELVRIHRRFASRTILEHRRQRFGGIQVVVEAFVEFRAAPGARADRRVGAFAEALVCHAQLEIAQSVDGRARPIQALESEIQLLAIWHGDQQISGSLRACIRARECRAAYRNCRAISTSFRLRPSGTRRASSSARTACPSATRTARSRSRDAGTRGPRRRCECRASRPGTSSPWRSTRCASPGGPGPMGVPRTVSPGLGAFHRAKSRALSLSYSSMSTRAPASFREIVLREFAVPGEFRDAEIGRAFARVSVALPVRRWIASTISSMCSVAGRGAPDLQSQRARVLEKRLDVCFRCIP